jgi:hypothetical protein
MISSPLLFTAYRPLPPDYAAHRTRTIDIRPSEVVYHRLPDAHQEHPLVAVAA